MNKELDKEVSSDEAVEALRALNVLPEFPKDCRESLTNTIKKLRESLDRSEFILPFLHLSKKVHQIAKDKGWWDSPTPDSEKIALMHSELSEALEGMRIGNPPDKHLPDYSSVEVELADVIIRIMDLGEARGYNIAGAIIDKIEYNSNREHKHGGKEF